MIRRLELEDFGRFRKAEVSFGPFTVVTGPNEAGKTTVFDALFDSLCAGSRHEGRPHWKNLAARYGALRKASLVWAEGASPLAFGDNEFLEIFAIRGGELSVKHPENKGASSWAEAAENALLNAGLNPARLAAALRDRAENSRKGSIRSRLARLKEAAADGERLAAGLKAERDAALGGAARAEQLEAERAQRASVLEAKSAELAALDSKVEEISSAVRLAAALEGVNALRDLKEAREEAAALEAYASPETPQYRALLASAREAERAAAASEAALAEKTAALEAAKISAEELAGRARTARQAGARAAELSSRLAAFAAAPGKVTVSVNKPLRLGLWAGGLLLAAAVAYFGGAYAAYAAAAAVLAVFGWLGFRFGVRQELSLRPPAETAAFLADLAAAWSAVSDEALPKDDLEGARNLLARAAAAADAAAKAAEARAADAAGLEAARKAAGAELEARRAAAGEAARAAEAWLKARNCASEDEYQAKAAEYRKRAAHAGDMEQRVRLLLKGHSCADEKELKDKLYTEKESAERKGVDPGKSDPEALERLRKERAALAAEVKALGDALAAVAADLKAARAVAGAKLGGLPERIGLAETELEAARAEAADLELQAEACTLAAGIFDELAASSALVFEQLGKEVSEVIKAVLPDSRAEFKVFDAAGASLTDATGVLRPVRGLSTGLRDLFMLAARLTIARRSRLSPEGLAPALLVLDEPFYSLDEERLRLAMALLAAFHRNTGWQVLILTKDPGVAAAAAAAGVALTRVDLAPAKPLLS